MRKPSRKTLEKKLTKLVGDYIKKRDNYICQKCGKVVEGQNCHPSHIIPVSQGNALRWNPLNIKTMCFHDHISWWHKHPTESGEWFKKKFPKRYKYLIKHKNDSGKFTIEDLQNKVKVLEELNE